MAEDGQQALDLAREHLPDAILLDQIMPKMDGKEVFSELRARGDTKDIPVVVLTGMDRETGDWPGAHFVGKPFSPEELLARLRDVLA